MFSESTVAEKRYAFLVARPRGRLKNSIENREGLTGVVLSHGVAIEKG